MQSFDGVFVVSLIKPVFVKNETLNADVMPL